MTNLLSLYFSSKDGGWGGGGGQLVETLLAGSLRVRNPIGIFRRINISGCTLALRLTQALTEGIIRDVSSG
jgi:hypothetical protein